ncbi:hypothetical protein B2D07_13965 [Desulfococcus multivorans]|nr:uncharacterized protein Dmul_27940 [Desulfococcus multivorans]AQV01758.1 hypothetical protein B2D07_13965 [Desulfococcus multivorans]
MKSRTSFPVRIKPEFMKPGFKGANYKGIALNRLLILQICRSVLEEPSLPRRENFAEDSDDAV